MNGTLNLFDVQEIIVREETTVAGTRDLRCRTLEFVSTDSEGRHQYFTLNLITDGMGTLAMPHDIITLPKPEPEFVADPVAKTPVFLEMCPMS